MQYGILLVSILVAFFFVSIVWNNMPKEKQCYGRNCPTKVRLAEPFNYDDLNPITSSDADNPCTPTMSWNQCLNALKNQASSPDKILHISSCMNNQHTNNFGRTPGNQLCKDCVGGQAVANAGYLCANIG